MHAINIDDKLWSIRSITSFVRRIVESSNCLEKPRCCGRSIDIPFKNRARWLSTERPFEVHLCWWIIRRAIVWRDKLYDGALSHRHLYHRACFPRKFYGRHLSRYSSCQRDGIFTLSIHRRVFARGYEVGNSSCAFANAIAENSSFQCYLRFSAEP